MTANVTKSKEWQQGCAAIDDWQVPAALSHSFARDYLLTFYSGDVDPDEKVVLDFLASRWKEIGRVATFIDLGCGPTIHHILTAAAHVDSIQVYDFVPECVEEVRKWKDRIPPVHNWNPWTRCALEAEQVPASVGAVEAREALVRSKITTLGFCDLRVTNPLGAPMTFPAVGCFYTTEQASMVEESWPTAKRRAAWEHVMSNVVSLVAPGGWLLMSCVGYTDFYVTYDQKTQSKTVHPLPYLTENDFSQALVAHGFNLNQITVRRERITGQEREGVTDVLLVAARR